MNPVFPLVEWVATRRCPGRCFYCYLRGAPAPSGPELPPSALREPLRKLGVRRLIVTGGEPLLLDGVEDFVLDCAASGIAVELLTRLSPSPRFLAALADTGGVSLHVGVDSLRPATAARIGAPFLPPSALADIARAAPGGVARTVVTPFNLPELPELLPALAEMGFRSLLVIFPAAPDGSEYPLPASGLTPLGLLFSSLLSRGVKVRVERPHSFPPPRRPPVVCASGRHSLTLFPDGSLGLCQHLPDALKVGSVLRDPPVDAAALDRFLNPPRSLFAGTPCEDCPSFDDCNASGRCWLSSLRAGTLFGPDAFCPLRAREGAP